MDGTTVQRIGKAGVEGSFLVKHCQDQMDEELRGGDHWLHLHRILQNIPGKGIATIMAHARDMGTVIVKAQFAADAKREYDIAERLRDVTGFVRFTCLFTCAGDKEYIESFGDRLTEPNRKLCEGRGDEMGVIVMPYYPLESLERALRAGTLPDRSIRDVIARTLAAAYEAFSTTGFVHGDLFAKNVLLETETDPLIADFERSSFDGNITQFWRDLDGFLNDVHRYAAPGLKSEIEDACRRIIMEMAWSREPTHAFVHDIAMKIYAHQSGGRDRSWLWRAAMLGAVIVVSALV